MTKSAAIGKCHVCKERRGINYCSMCDHWFCIRCQSRTTKRAVAALAERVFGRKENCCGPDA